MRSVIAKRLSESKSTIPHTYSTVEADITHLLSERKRLKELGVNVSVNDFVVKAVAEALMRCPNVNVLYKNGQVNF
jgi:pyruvate/2-oxoglutarate dehydrogenase complex dihydrolipoamide acyltransferase (E2) component